MTYLKYKRRDLDEAAMKVLSRKAILFAFSRLLEFEANAIAKSRHSLFKGNNVIVNIVADSASGHYSKNKDGKSGS